MFLGNGDGTFQNPTTTAAGNGIASIVVSDFNLDGKLDVAFSNANWADITWLPGNGDGLFETPLQFSGISSQFAEIGNPLAVADFDGNGSPDIAVQNGGGISLLLSAGKNGSAALLSAAALAFGNQNVGQASAVQTVVLSNTNSTALSVTGISVSGAQSGDYAQTNTCGISLAAGANCTISVTFTPQAAGLRSGMIQITDSAINAPQSVGLSGTGVAAPSFTFGVGSGGSSSSTISAGGTATFGLAITPTGSFSGTVNFSCSVAPAMTPPPLCSVPSSVSVSGTSATTVTVTVSTTAASSAGGKPFRDWPLSPWPVIWTVALGVSSLLLFGRRQRLVLAPMVVLALLIMAGCGGSSSTSGSSGSKGTPAGTYTATVTATSGTLSQQMALTVIVQ